MSDSWANFLQCGKVHLTEIGVLVKTKFEEKTFKPFVEAQFKMWKITNYEMDIYWISNFKIFHVKIKAQLDVAAKKETVICWYTSMWELP